MNVITPDNFKSQRRELATVMMENAAENIEKTVECIFKKAWAEEKYAKTYVELCQHLIDTELAAGGEKTKKTEAKSKSTFRQKLLKTAQRTFENFFQKLHEDEDDEETRRKRRKQMLGNNHFLGELFSQKLISRNVALTILR